ncbi:MAG: L-type lectin-domain containing protein, partial [Flavobacteriales bacterium]
MFGFLCTTSPWAQNYFLNGDATFLGDDCYLLTPAVNTQNGTVWYGDQLDLNEPFNIQFTMNFGSNDDNGADGIVFVLQTVGVTAIGESGGGIGYLGFDPSFGIEFDTWFNGDYGDPFYDHIAMVSNGVVDHNAPSNIAGPVQASGGDINIEDGQDHVVQVIWNPTTMTMSVSFDCLFRLVGNVDLIEDIFQGQNLVYWGFTSAT